MNNLGALKVAHVNGHDLSRSEYAKEFFTIFFSGIEQSANAIFLHRVSRSLKYRNERMTITQKPLTAEGSDALKGDATLMRPNEKLSNV